MRKRKTTNKIVKNFGACLITAFEKVRRPHADD